MGYTSGTKWTYELVKETLLVKGYILIDLKYKNALTKLTFKDVEGYYYYSSVDCFTKFKPNRFYKSNIYTLRNIEHWCELNNKLFSLIDNQEYINNSKKLKWQCLKDDCGEIFEASWNNVQSGWGCGYCAGKKVGLSNCLAIKSPELAKQWHPVKNKQLTPYDITINSHKYVWWKCLECGHEWFVSPNSRINNNTGCPQCNQSKGERIIKEWLVNYNINYVWQKEFEGLIGLGNGNLSYDFYLPDYNLLIEYQGEFHDGTINKKSILKQSKEDFEKQQEHDQRKRNYAKIHNISLLEIWYWDFNKIEEILKNELKIKEEL